MLSTNKNDIFCYFINICSSLFEAGLSHKSTQSREVRPPELTFSEPRWTSFTSQMIIVWTQIKYKKTKPIILDLNDHWLDPNEINMFNDYWLDPNGVTNLLNDHCDHWLRTVDTDDVKAYA
jgi:hypothetical protein